jgi:hypothetical protein
MQHPLPLRGQHLPVCATVVWGCCLIRTCVCQHVLGGPKPCPLTPKPKNCQECDESSQKDTGSMVAVTKYVGAARVNCRPLLLSALLFAAGAVMKWFFSIGGCCCLSSRES